MLKIMMPIYTATFPQDLKKSYFSAGGRQGPPLESPMGDIINSLQWGS